MDSEFDKERERAKSEKGRKQTEREGGRKKIDA